MHAVHKESFPRQAERYGERRNLSLSTILLVLGGHVLLLALLMAQVQSQPVREIREPLVVSMSPQQEEPPPNVEPAPPPPAAIAAPAPVVRLPRPAPIAAPAPDPEPPRQSPPAPAPQIRVAPAPAGPVSAGDLTSRILSAKPPRYPMDSRRLKEEGTVVLSLLLSPDGRVEQISVARSSGHQRLDRAALAAVRSWRWSPTLRDGQAVAVKGFVEIPFVLTRS